ncbi:Cof-type HAD-IIB family hydrolase [Salinibacillus xinjiangensis]|uniref:Cof-type HAD-IIB family hydrolase n=1 Tax=Salinibacillus xinjiangensis TaxID=1229268 RepID=A0A6G1X8C7_9BACI|nr:Cof-type HAD-IIB family hydrolase [Salinibacillus xinjiangensis]MRG87058.1 Cof-type HAD-IIB family hydrolase [Salinibacillus xinjiangensis]
MSKHLIALDLDGTLLSDDKVIRQKTKQTLQRAKENGHIVVIATGRPHRASIEYYTELGLDTPMVNMNGALIHHPLDKRWDVVHSPMSIRTAHAIVETCYDFSVPNVMAEIRDHVFLDKHDQEILDIFQPNPNEFPVTIGSLKNTLKEDPTSMLISPDKDHVTQLRKHLDDHHAEVIDHRKWGAPWHIIEIVRAGLSKAVGLKKIAHYYNIPQERIIAFGDEDNDLEMIEYAGIGVAMGNGIQELKSIANYTTKTNEEEGISLFLEDFLNTVK